VAMVPRAFGLGCDGGGTLALGVTSRSYCAEGEGFAWVSGQLAIDCSGLSTKTLTPPIRKCAYGWGTQGGRVCGEGLWVGHPPYPQPANSPECLEAICPQL
jgi:hypothetical protein